MPNLGILLDSKDSIDLRKVLFGGYGDILLEK